MGRRLKLMRIAGVDVYLHWTCWIAPVYIVYIARNFGDRAWLVIGVLIFLLLNLSFCVLLHELGHALMARRFGVTTKDIIITPIGGLARLNWMPKKPNQEFLISLAGPLVNLLIAVLLGMIFFCFGGSLLPSLSFDGLSQLPVIMLWINLALFLLNLIPAFPMDGGRMLRSVLARRMSYYQATVIAGRSGQMSALLFSIYVLREKQYPLILIGIFVFVSARFELKQARLSQASELGCDTIGPAGRFKGKKHRIGS